MVGTLITTASSTLRNPSHDGYYRLAVAGGKNINFPIPTYSSPSGPAQDFGTDGGLHNFLRYLENWGSQTVHYKGSLVSLYYSTYNTGTFKCCTTVYGVPRETIFLTRTLPFRQVCRPARPSSGMLKVWATARY